MAHAIEQDTPAPDNTAAGSEDVQLGSTRSSGAGDAQLESDDNNESASEAGGDFQATQTHRSPTSGTASSALESEANNAAVDSRAEPQELQQLLEALQFRSSADSLAAQQRLLSSPAPVTSHDADRRGKGKSVPADECAAPVVRQSMNVSAQRGTSDQQRPLEPSATQQQAAGSCDSSSSSSEDSWTPASRSSGTPRATGASQATASSRTGSLHDSTAGEAARPPGSSGWTPRAAPGVGAASEGALRYPRANYAAAEAARTAQQRAKTLKVRRSGSARRSAGARRQVFCGPKGVAAVRRQSRPSSGAAARGIGVAAALDSTSQRPRSGGVKVRPHRWSGAAAPGVQLYGRVHAWKEGNKQR